MYYPQPVANGMQTHYVNACCLLDFAMIYLNTTFTVFATKQTILLARAFVPLACGFTGTRNSVQIVYLDLEKHF